MPLRARIYTRIQHVVEHAHMPPQTSKFDVIRFSGLLAGAHHKRTCSMNALSVLRKIRPAALFGPFFLHLGHNAHHMRTHFPYALLLLIMKLERSLAWCSLRLGMHSHAHLSTRFLERALHICLSVARHETGKEPRLVHSKIWACTPTHTTRACAPHMPFCCSPYNWKGASLGAR
eukprot:1159415-Pelagomonas_calceolata.AAC.3